MSAAAGRKVRVAMVGCGQIADAHLQELTKIPTAEIVAACDVHRDLAMQAALRFDVPHFYDDLGVMLAAVRPDIVHLATPVHTHAALAEQIMAGGAHVYVEKPFTPDVRDAERLLQAANTLGRMVCVGHDQLYDPAWLELRERVANGEIGEVRHVESVLGYPFSGQFGSVVRADAGHWVRRLPGGLFQNTISHPFYRITEYLADDHPEIVARWWTRPDFDFPTELLVHMRGASVTGTLTFSTGIASQRLTRVYGERGLIEIDLDAQSVTTVMPPALPGAFGKLEAPFRRWREASRVVRRNVWRFARSDIHYFAGMKGLFERFQHAAMCGTEWPISAAEILRVTRLMDEIFTQCREAAPAPAATSVVKPAPAMAEGMAPVTARAS